MFFRTEQPQALVGKVFASLLAPTAFTFGADLLGQYEGASMGLSWADIFNGDAFPVGAVMLLLTCDVMLYSLLAW